MKAQVNKGRRNKVLRKATVKKPVVLRTKRTTKKVVQSGMEYTYCTEPRNAFAHLFSVCVTLVLVLSFLVTPITDAYASEISEESAPRVEVVEPAVEEVVEVTAETENVPEELVEARVVDEQEENVVPLDVQNDTEVVPEETSEVVPEQTGEEVVPVVADTTVDTALDTTTEEIATTTLPIDETPASSHETTDTTSTSTPLVTASTTEEVIPEVIEDVATTTEPVAATTTEFVLHHTTDANLYSFSSTECIPVGDGAFHCVKREDMNAGGAAQVFKDVYSAKDQDGDMEIYHVVNGVSEKLTNNGEDDSAPALDPVTGDIVWHTLKDDRYQIMLFEKQSGVVSQITHESFNSMQPSTYDGVIVWQAWKSDNWEVIEKDGEEITALTENTTHDINPSIQVEYVSWQADENGEWKAKIYNRKTKHIDTVSGVDGGKIVNPRIVLVFDNAKENGDVETVGFDPANGETVTLGNTPVPLPAKLPEPEQQGEEKALIQPTITPKIETKATSTPDIGDEPALDSEIDMGTTTPAVLLPTVTTTPVVILPTASTTTSVDISTSTDLVLDTVPEVVVQSEVTTPIATTTEPTIDVSHIDEIVIPAYEPATTTSQ